MGRSGRGQDAARPKGRDPCRPASVVYTCATPIESPRVKPWPASPASSCPTTRSTSYSAVNNAQRILFDEADYWFLWERLGAGAAKFQCDIHAYVLMPTHLHLVVTPHAEDGIGKMMQYVGRYYVQYFNQRYDCTGTLWDGRYRATLIDPRRWLNTCARYVEQNPIRAGLVTEAGAYDWSSHGANCGGREDTLVCPHPAYLALGRSIRARQAAWRTLVGRAPAGGRPGAHPLRHQQGMGPGGPGLLCRDRGEAQPPRHTPGPRRRPRSAAYRQQAAAARSAERMSPGGPCIHHPDPGEEYPIAELCRILEVWNRPDDPALSVARARVAPGVTTRLHRLAGTIERYLILAGQGRVEIGDLAPEVVGPGDLVHIPAGCPQRITNSGDTDLVFLALCTPRFTQAVYEDLDPA